ncbi:hypothetical protein CYMTET_5820 [Cymbomonas tetramitiformis]|uniref:Bacterial type II secretion system protein E domain-containing protein n=1 Tax=Cymbomonas tetramitiformis TaxID=36881 RepID=A0AAE0LJ25_9CHLO|nr:hypothetical protein CYMTET_5820 [Cymbomonas tetramitiformis]
MFTDTQGSITKRGLQAIYTSLGVDFVEALEARGVTDIHANPDGSVWIDRVGTGIIKADFSLTPANVRVAINAIAAMAGLKIDESQPQLSAIVPVTGERFQALIPPVVDAPCFSIRKPPTKIFRLDDYVSSGIMSPKYSDYLKQAVIDRKNIIVAGSTGSGKTTLLNALLAEPAFSNDRIYTIEDVKELQVNAGNLVSTFTKTASPAVTMNDLVRNALRQCPDRIIIGEVRGGEAYELLKAWNTGHEGGIASVHANGAMEALYRFEDLVGEVVASIPKQMIGRTIDVIVFIQRFGTERKVVELMEVEAFGQDMYVTKKVMS